MPFDFSAGHRAVPDAAGPAPHRPRPGAADALPAGRPPSAREDGGARAPPPARRLLAVAGFDAAPALRAIAGEAARDMPAAFRVRRDVGRLRRAAHRLGAARRPAAKATARRPIGELLAALPAARRAARAALPRLRGGLRDHRRRHRDHSLARGLPAFALGAGGQGRPALRRGACAGRRQRAAASRPATVSPASSPATIAGSASSGRSRPTRGCTSIRARDAGLDWPTRRRCRSGRRARAACATSARPSSRCRAPARRCSRSVSPASRSTRPCARATTPPGCTTRSPACRPACSPTAA